MTLFQEFDKLAAVAEDGDVAVADHSNFRIGRKDGNDAAKFVGYPPIVAVQEGHDFAVAFRDPSVEGGSLPAVLFMYVANLRHEFADDLTGAVSRAVVDDDNFALARGEILFENAENGLFDESLVVISIDQDADVRPSHGRSPARPIGNSR